MQSGIPLMPEQASTISGEVDALYLFLVALTVFFSLAIAGTLLYFAVKFRRRNRNEIPTPIEGAIKLEILWSVIPFLISMFIFGWGASLYFKIYRPPKEALDIYVVAKQWMWKFQHLDGQREINELHVPVGRKVKLTMTTEDVIHAFFVPAFRVKTDVVPGRYTTAWFEPTKPGRYHLFCAEYCGTSHSGMIGWIVVMEPTEYQTWLSGGAGEGSLASTGQKVFQDLACNTCHRSDAQGRGPNLEGLFGKQIQLADGTTVTMNEDYIRESIRNPRAKIHAGFQPIMPVFPDNLASEEQILQLIAYIRSLGAQQPGATTNPGNVNQGTTGVSPSDAGRAGPLAPTQPRGNQRPPQ